MVAAPGVLGTSFRRGEIVSRAGANWVLRKGGNREELDVGCGVWFHTGFPVHYLSLQCHGGSHAWWELRPMGTGCAESVAMSDLHGFAWGGIWCAQPRPSLSSSSRISYLSAPIILVGVITVNIMSDIWGWLSCGVAWVTCWGVQDSLSGSLYPGGLGESSPACS